MAASQKNDDPGFFSVVFTLFFFFALIWHAVMIFSTSTELTGFFQRKPASGYVWSSSRGTEERRIWSSSDVTWMPGTPYPGLHVIAAVAKDVWVPAPGYAFTNPEHPEITKTRWVPGDLDPGFNVVALATEGRWSPAPGYGFINDAQDDLRTRWIPGSRHPIFHAISANKEGGWVPAAGYKFLYDETATHFTSTVWNPGASRGDGSGAVAGATEGSWVMPYPSTSSSQIASNGGECESCEDAGKSFAYMTAGKLSEWLFGKDNSFSREAYKEAVVSGVTAAAKALR